MSYIISMNNGKSIKNCESAGNYFVTSEKVNDEIFTGGLDLIIVSGIGDNEYDMPPLSVGEHRGLALRHSFSVHGKYYFNLGEPDTSEADALRDRSDIDYLLMMAGEK